jgi:hypothetical protein
MLVSNGRWRRMCQLQVNLRSDGGGRPGLAAEVELAVWLRRKVIAASV